LAFFSIRNTSAFFGGQKKRDKVLYTLTDKELKRKTEQREIETEIEMNHYSFLTVQSIDREWRKNYSQIQTGEEKVKY
jgi:hypothetical protein